ncbi:MAG: IS110 family transposase [Thermonemataceae bacterium]|nr:IS110 family transposase [Thermonemataceae bacterium]
MNTIYIGIDISKDTLVVAYPSLDEQFSSAKFTNTPVGIHQFIKTLPAHAHCISEATGSYGLLLVYYLTQQQIPISVVNPKQSANFAKVLLSTVKTDARDATMLSIYGQKMQPQPYVMPDDKVMQYKQLRVLLRQLKKQLSALSNLEHALSFHPKQQSTVQASLQRMLTSLRQEIATLEGEITKISEDEFKHILKLMTSISGIGKKTASALIMATNGLKNFNSAKKLAKFIGVVPTIKNSGTSLKINGHISRSGDPELRALLYMAACSAIRCNPACKETYTRLKANGKKAKIALVAVMNKLIRQIFAVVKNNTPFQKSFVPVRNI